jgi:cyclopropane-fatty-acyl-phospholipid synthase
MANQKEIEAMYDWVDYFHVLRLGDYADFTCAFYDGDFSKTLEQAQRDKHDFALNGINFKPGHRILDIGCGWGPMLNAVRERGGKAVGFTLSSAQNQYNVSKGLDSRLQDYKSADPKEVGRFDGVVSIGALEHFCSIEEFKAGKQEEVYRDFFRFCSDVLPDKGRLYLHMMVWGKHVPNPDDLSLKAPEGSEERILARTEKFYPGSWLPEGKDQLVRCAEPYFDFISTNNGRLDYIETLKGWGDWSSVWASRAKTWKAIKGFAKLLPKFIMSKDFRTQLSFLRHHDQTEIFKREIFSHERMFFEKRAS